MISDTADRDALLRQLDLEFRLANIANEFADLGVSVVAYTMICAAHEALAVACLPQVQQKRPWRPWRPFHAR